jgi:microsomal epoxide hydrolase
MSLLRAFVIVACLALSGAARADVSFAQGEVDVGADVKIHYVEGGDKAAAATLLFVPGWSMSGAVWRQSMEAFAGAARVVAIDPRSQGMSTISMRGNTPEQRARDLRRVIETLALRNVVLVGWSQGVQDVAAYAAAFEGAGISGYVLVDAAVAAGPAAVVARPQDLQQQLERMAMYQRYPREYLGGMLNAIIRSPKGRERIDEYVAAGLRTPPDLGVGMLLADFITVDRRPALAKFNRPTLVIAAADAGDLQEQREMARTIAGASLETVADAGHAVFLDQPQRFQQLLADFLQRLRKS